jgi:hypothetical protein
VISRFKLTDNLKFSCNFSVFVVMKHVKAIHKFEANAQGQDGRQTNDELSEFFNFSSVILPKILPFAISSLTCSVFSYPNLLRAVSDV